MFDPSSFANPTPLAHADTSRDVLPRGGTSQFQKHRVRVEYEVLLMQRELSDFLDSLPFNRLMASCPNDLKPYTESLNPSFLLSHGAL
ncbi:hypothetical protein TNCV_565631 [Trichonephila clavipes]|nr:hypothetical protein TNCV_565631 [Trichonephila clavipes]